MTRASRRVSHDAACRFKRKYGVETDFQFLTAPIYVNAILLLYKSDDIERHAKILNGKAIELNGDI